MYVWNWRICYTFRRFPFTKITATRSGTSFPITSIFQQTVAPLALWQWVLITFKFNWANVKNLRSHIGPGCLSIILNYIASCHAYNILTKQNNFTDWENWFCSHVRFGQWNGSKSWRTMNFYSTILAVQNVKRSGRNIYLTVIFIRKELQINVVKI